MKKTVLVFGLLSGAVSSAMMLLTIPFMESGLDGMELLGYTTIIASFLLVFFGVRSYRDRVAGGALSFSRAFTVGLSITLVSCVCYVLTWEAIYFGLRPNFTEQYAARTLERARESGASAQEIEAAARRMEEFKVMYDNPLINAGITFMEPFPIGLAVALVSAGILRRRAAAQPSSLDTRTAVV